MKKEDKSLLVKELAQNIADYSHFYVVDAADMNSGKTSDLRRLCFNKEVKMLMVKNTLFVKALKESEGDYEELYDTLKGSSAVFFLRLFDFRVLGINSSVSETCEIPAP